MKKLIALVFSFTMIWACGNSPDNKTPSDAKPVSMVKEKVVSDKGVGEIKDVKLNDPLDEASVARGKGFYELKCAACHKLTSKRVVGPGWEGLTDRRKPEWIMNMITNVDIMLEKDPEAQKLLEECLTRMPNQNVSVEEARDILEFIFQNDLDRAAKKS